MFGLRVWYKNGSVENFYFGSEEDRERKANWYMCSENVDRVTMFELGGDL